MYFGTIKPTSPAYCDSFARGKISLHKKGKSELQLTRSPFLGQHFQV